MRVELKTFLVESEELAADDVGINISLCLPDHCAFASMKVLGIFEIYRKGREDLVHSERQGDGFLNCHPRGFTINYPDFEVVFNRFANLFEVVG